MHSKMKDQVFPAKVKKHHSLKHAAYIPSQLFLTKIPKKTNTHSPSIQNTAKKVHSSIHQVSSCHTFPIIKT
jgi:hypothetical protein